MLNKTEEQRPLRSPTVSFILNPFRHCYGSERSSGRGVLFSPAGPLFVQRPLFIPQQSAGYGYQMEKYVDSMGHHRSQLLCIEP